MNITELSATALSEAIHRREVSCREVMQSYLAQIERLNPRHNALVSLRDADVLLREADDCDARLKSFWESGRESERKSVRESAPKASAAQLGWMFGMPQAIKDIAFTKGLRTTQGSPLTSEFIPTADGLMVERMKASGCIVIGKSNTPEFGLGSHTFNEVFGVTRNAYDSSKTAGGSSGGAAVALALRMLPVADGSDFMGSLRNPAGWNNIFGMRPSQGRVPMYPAADVWVAQLGTEGPMGRSVEDVARLLDVQAGPDPRSPLSLGVHSSFGDALNASPDAWGASSHASAVATRTADAAPTIGWLADLQGHLAMEPGVLEVCEQALKRLQSAGCNVEPAELGYSADAVWQAWLVWRRWLVAARIAPFLADPANRAKIKPEALWEHDQAAGLTGMQTLQASAERSAFYQHMLTLFERYDFLALPSAQVWPFDVEQRWPQQIAGRQMDTYHRWMEVTIIATFAGLPCISVPAGFSESGLPMGLQLIGRPQADLSVLQIARRYEQIAREVIDVRPRAERLT